MFELVNNMFMLCMIQYEGILKLRFKLRLFPMHLCGNISTDFITFRLINIFPRTLRFF